MIHLSLLVGELSGTVGRSLVDNIGGLDFHISGGVGLIEEELDESALQACALTDVDRETRAGDFHTEVEVYEVVFLCQIPVGEGILGEIGHRATGFLNYVVLGGFTFRHHVAGEVGDSAEEVAELLLCGCELHGYLLLGILEGTDLSLGLICLVLLALLHQLADGGGDTVQLGGLVVIVEL